MALIAWFPVLFFPIGVALLALEGAAVYFALLCAAYLAVILWSVLICERSLPDRLAGTYLVPR